MNVRDIEIERPTMSTATTTERTLLCPSCRKKGRRVSPVTMRALLQPEYQHEVAEAPTASCNAANGTGCKALMAATGYRFCDSHDCGVVYFAEDGGSTFTKPQLRVSVGVKETTGERPLCYCFGHSVASIKDELRTKGHSEALEDIRRKMKTPGCRCETKNPSGDCCLGNVAKGITIAREELEMTDSDAPGLASRATSSSGRGEKISKAGMLISSVIASSCCWLPLLLLAVGVSGAGIASTLHAFRPVFIVVTLGFLAAAFWLTYRRKAAAGPGHDSCVSTPAGTDECCVTPAKRSLSIITVNKVMLWVVTVLAVAFLFFPNYVGALLGTDVADTTPANMSRAEFKVEGMTCEGCAATVTKSLQKVSGVLAVEVSHERGEAVVGTEACCAVPNKEILAAIESAGYHGSPQHPSGAAKQSELTNEK